MMTTNTARISIALLFAASLSAVSVGHSNVAIAADSQAGLTYAAVSHDETTPVVTFECDNGQSSANCDVAIASLTCLEEAPILCIRDINAPGPVTADQESWSAGLIALSPPVMGVSLSSGSKADAVCQDSFGAKWRVASIQDGNGGKISGYGRQAAQDQRAWIADRVNPERTCWQSQSTTGRMTGVR